MTKTERSNLDIKLEVIEDKILWHKNRLSGIMRPPSSKWEYFDKTIPKYIVKHMLEMTQQEGIIEGLEKAKEIILRGKKNVLTRQSNKIQEGISKALS
jgi:hypothetical protein